MKLVVIFDNFGPYHMARLNSLAERCRLVGIECYSRSSEYSWGRVGNGSFEHRTLLDGDNASPSALSQAIKGALFDISPDAVFIPGWDHIAALSALIWCQNTGTPAIVMSDSQERDVPRTWLKEFVKRRVLRHASACFVAGRRHRDYVDKLGVPAKFIKMGYDVVDNEYFKKNAEISRRLPSRKLRRPYFLASSRLIPRKNINNLIEGYGHYRAQAIRQQIAPKDLVVLGDGPERRSLDAQIRDCGLSEVVHLPGFVQYQNLPEYYANATAFIHIPTSEQWGLVVNEALASGLPAIVSLACGCAPDLISEGQNGYLVDARDTGELAECLIKFERCSLQEFDSMRDASLRIIEGFSIHTFSDNALDVANLAVNEGKQRTSYLDRLILLFLRTIRNN